VLVRNSCTGLITEDELLGIPRSTSGEIRCELQVLGIHGAAADHPWALPAPEGRCLECITTRLRPLQSRASVV